MMRFTCFSRNACTAAATARYVLPVPAGPTPMVTVFFSTDAIYSFWPSVFGFTGRPLAEMHSTSPANSLICSSLPVRTMSMI